MSSNELGRAAEYEGFDYYDHTPATKWDVLERSRLPKEDQSQIEYRVFLKNVEQSRYAVYALLNLSLGNALLGLLLNWLVSHLDQGFSFKVMFVVGLVNGLVAKFLLGFEGRIASLLFSLSIFFWFVLIGVHSEIPLVAKLSLMIAIVAPFIYWVILAERIGEHYLWWLSAEPKVSLKLRESLRIWWTRQFLLFHDFNLAAIKSGLTGNNWQGFILLASYGVLLALFLVGHLGFYGYLVTTSGFLIAFLLLSVSWLPKEAYRLSYQAIHSFFNTNRLSGQVYYSGLGWVINFFLKVLTIISLFSFLIWFAVANNYSEFSWFNYLSFLVMALGLMAFIYLSADKFLIFFSGSSQRRSATPSEYWYMPPGAFRGPVGSHQNRYYGVAFAIFLTSVGVNRSVEYFPFGFYFGNQSEWFSTYVNAVEKREYSLTKLLMGLNRYQPLGQEQLKKSLSLEQKEKLRSLGKVSVEAQYRYLYFLRMDHYLESSPGAWLGLLGDGVGEGRGVAVVSLIVTLISLLGYPLVLLYLSVVLVSGRILASAAKVIGEHQAEQAAHQPLSDWDGYVSRLQESAKTDPAGAHLWWGVNATEDYPVLVHRDILKEHVHILGDSGSGKSARGLAPLMSQLIRANDAAVVIIDLKGDMALFENARIEAGERFKYFTNMLGRSTHLFNPLAQIKSDCLSVNQICEVFLAALSLEHGDGYGKSYYSRVARDAFSRLLREFPTISSFSELREKAEKFFSKDSSKYNDAFELIAVIESLAGFEQLNFKPQEGSSLDSNILEQQIYFPDVIENNEVVYFWLPASIEGATVREIAKLALYTLVVSASIRSSWSVKERQVWVMIDEFQHIASLNFKFIIQQARSMGVGLILANQTTADLWRADSDLRNTIQANTRLKQYFALSDPDDRRRLLESCGESIYQKYYLVIPGTATEQTQDRYLPLELGPRFNQNDLITVTNRPEESIFHVGRSAGYTQFGGYPFVLRSEFHITKAEYQRRSKASWPAPTEKTLVVNAKELTQPKPLETKLLSSFRILTDQEQPPPHPQSIWDEKLNALYQRFH